MPLASVRPVDAIYEAVDGHDLVLVPDAPLASAINRRLDRPHFGTFATTPRRLAAGRRETAEDRLAFVDVVERTDLDWKAAAGAVGDVLQCWEHRGSVDAILDYERFATPDTGAVVDVLRDADTTSRRLAEHAPPADRRVAVVGEPELTTLERSVVPDDATRVEVLDDRPADLEPFRIFDSATGIVDALLDVVTPANADRVAVVLDESSRFSTLVESALEAAEVPYSGDRGSSTTGTTGRSSASAGWPTGDRTRGSGRSARCWPPSGRRTRCRSSTTNDGSPPSTWRRSSASGRSPRRSGQARSTPRWTATRRSRAPT